MGKGFMAIEVSHELVDPKVLVNSRNMVSCCPNIASASFGGCDDPYLDGQNKRGYLPKGKEVNIPLPG